MSDVIIRDKAEYHERTTDQMERHLTVPPWSLRQKIALTCRILAAEGHESALAGQMSARGERPGTYWMLSFGLGFDGARASNIVLVDDDLQLHVAIRFRSEESSASLVAGRPGSTLIVATLTSSRP